MKDFCQTNELEEDENSDLGPQSDSKVSKLQTEIYDSQWQYLSC